MNIWVAVDASEALASLRNQALALAQTIGLSPAPYTLPQHISLKISFPIDDALADDVIEAMTSLLEKTPSFPIEPERIEQNGTILWLVCRASDALRSLHNALDRMLSERYQIPQHPFDLAFCFHSTLAIDSDEEKIRTAADALTASSVPTAFVARRFLIGTSPDGAAGTYSVCKAGAFLISSHES